jgi:hypothetical protein
VSKRRNRKKSNQPNLPQETLARARREAGLEAEEEIEEVEEEQVEVAPVAAKPVKAASRKAEVPAARSSESLPPVQRRKRRRGTEDPTQMSQEEISERLANPVRTVSTEALAKQYSYVISDLRSMWLLAGALFVIMIVAAQFLGH